MWMRLQESHGSPTPQNPWSPGTQGVGWPSPKDIEEAVKECISGNCGKVREIIRIATYMGPLMKIMGGFVVNTLRNYGFSTSKIERIAIIDGRRLKRLMRLGDVFEFKLVSEFKPRTIFDAYWQFTSLTTLKLPFVVRSRFDPSNDACIAFGDEEACRMFIAGYFIAESPKSNPYRFKYMGTTHPASVVILSIYLAMKMITKVYINGQKDVRFIFALPKDIERFIENVWRDPAVLMGLTDEEFLAFLSGLITGDGSIKWSRAGIEVALTGNLRKEKHLYAVIQNELLRRFRVNPFLREDYNDNTTKLVAQNDNAIKLLRLLPPLIEPLKELRRQLVLRRGMIGVFTAKKIFELLGDGKRKEEKGVHGLQSYQATRFLMVLARLGLIRLKEVEGREYHILETPQTRTGGSSNQQKYTW